MNTLEKTLNLLCITDIPTIISEEHPIKLRCYLDDWDIDRMAEDYKDKIDEIIEFLCNEGAIDVLYEDYEKYDGSLSDFIRDCYSDNEELLGFIIVETAEHIYVDSITKYSATDMLSDCFVVFQELISHELNNTVLPDNTSDIPIANFLNFSPIS